MTLRRYSLLFGIVAACLVFATCRYDTIWTGVQFDSSGQTIELSSAEPLCGCLQITNISKNDVHIRSTLVGRELGSMNLPAGHTARIHFDWGGPSGAETFVLDTWTHDGHRVKAQDVLRIDNTGWPWQPCIGHLPGKPEPPKCEVGPLKLETGRAQL